MQLQALTLSTGQLAGQRAFYLETLGASLAHETAETMTFQLGSSQLTFKQDDHFTGFYHVALDIPRNRVAQARTWLQKRLVLLADDDGKTVFPPTERWHTTSIYFGDAAGNILEFIARHDLLNDSAAAFSPASIRHISELGVVVPDVAGAVHHLGQTHQLHPFNGQSDTFTAVGGHDGMLIVVREGRGWMPVSRPAVAAPFVLQFSQNGHTQRITEASV